ncbi:MAG: response regulator [Bacteroidia bacterium]
MTPIRILLVEDNEGDILLTTEALEEAKILNEVTVVRDGELAIELLQNALLKPATLPDLILLDVNLPKKNGHEVLMSIKNNPKLCHIPVIMLTTSSSPADIKAAYEEHVNCYIVKPVEAESFIKMTASIEEFWFSIVKLPGKN